MNMFRRRNSTLPESKSTRQCAAAHQWGEVMTIWVDADACPNVIKDILYRASERMQMPLVLVANQSLRVPPSRFISTLRVPAGFDVADNEIVRQCSAGDLVITADIPLAAEVIEKGAAALNPRGERYTEATIRERLMMRDFMDTLRASGIRTGGRTAFRPATDSILRLNWISGGWKFSVENSMCNLLFTLYSL